MLSDIGANNTADRVVLGKSPHGTTSDVTRNLTLGGLKPNRTNSFEPLSAVSSPSGVWGGAPAAIDFETIWAWKNTFRSKLEKPNYVYINLGHLTIFEELLEICSGWEI